MNRCFKSEKTSAQSRWSEFCQLPLKRDPPIILIWNARATGENRADSFPKNVHVNSWLCSNTQGNRLHWIPLTVPKMNLCLCPKKLGDPSHSMYDSFSSSKALNSFTEVIYWAVNHLTWSFCWKLWAHWKHNKSPDSIPKDCLHPPLIFSFRFPYNSTLLSPC